MKLFRLITLAIALIAITRLGYCDTSAVITQADNDIPADTRAAIHAINNKLFESMKDDKPNVMMNMFVEEGRTDRNLEASVTDTYKKLGELAKGTTFEILHEYLIDAKGKGPVTVTLPGDGENKFIIAVDAGKGPISISLLSSKGNFRDPMLCFVYLKTKDGWQLYTFHSGIYKVAGKSAIQWYEDARAMYDAGWDVPAMLWMQLVGTFIRPAPFIQYDKEKEIQDFVSKGAAETARKYRFPFKATWVKGMPMIYSLSAQFNEKRLIPVVLYVTKYPLNRGVPIQEEVDAITSKIDKVIPGITKCGGEIAYEAYSEPPNQDKKAKYRGLLSKVK